MPFWHFSNAQTHAKKNGKTSYTFHCTRAAAAHATRGTASSTQYTTPNLYIPLTKLHYVEDDCLKVQKKM